MIPKPARTSSDLTLFRHCIISGSGLWERLAACTRCLLPWRPDTAKCPLGSAWSQCSIRQQSKALLTFGPPHRSVENDPMYGPAVRRKRISSFCRHCGLASMYPASDWSSFVLRAIMDISAHAVSLADRPRTGQTGHQGSHAPERPVLHFVSSSRRPRRATRLCHCLLLFSVVPLFGREPFLRPGLLSVQGAARQGCQGWPLLAATRRAWP